MKSFHEDDDDDDFEEKPSFVKTKTSNGWLILGSLLEFISDIFMGLHKFFSVLMDISLQKYSYINEQRKFQTQVALEIEMLTSGKYDATSTESGGSVGSGTSFEED